MGTLIVRCDTPLNLRAIEREIRAHLLVTDFVQMAGLKKLGTVTHTDGPGHKNDVRNFLYHLAPVLGVIDGDAATTLGALDTVPFAASRGAFEMPLTVNQYFHAWDDKPGVVPWTQRPRATSFLRESTRRGSNIVVSVHDSGVDATHTDEFGARVQTIYESPLDGPGNHGTGVASLIAGNNCGFLNDATVLNAKCFSAASSNGVISEAVNSLDALVTWVQANLTAGVHVIANCSFGSTNLFFNEYESVIGDIEAEGVAVFAASGNFGWNLDTEKNFWPAEALAHGACGAVNLKAEHMNFSNHGSGVKLHGLGWKVPAAAVGNGNYAQLTGTSFGCPAVAGAYGTWATSREAPRSKAEVEQLVGEYVDFCKRGKLGIRPDENPSISSKACVAKSDTSPV